MSKVTKSIAVAAAISLLGLTACSGSTAEGQTTLKYASYSVEDSAAAKSWNQWMDSVSDATGNNIQFDTYYNESLLKADDILNGVSDGRADIGYTAGGYTTSSLPLFNISSVPFISDNSPATAKTLTELGALKDSELQDEFHANGVHLLTVSPLGSNMLVSKEPIQKLNDMRGKRVRAVGYIQGAFEDVGADTVGMGQPDVYEALQRGVLDMSSAVTLPLITNYKYQEVADHFVDTGMGDYGVVMNVINLDVWNDFPDDVKAAMNDATEQNISNEIENLKAAGEEACTEIREAGGEVSRLADSEIDDWRTKSADKAKDEWKREAKAATDSVDDFWDKYTQKLEENSNDIEFTPAAETCAKSKQ